MNIAILGYGRMGRLIEQIATESGHNIILAANSKTSNDDLVRGLENADVAIDFTMPAVAADVISQALHQGVPVISGTTAWLNRYDEIAKLCYEKQGAFLYSSNFSIGVNIFFELNQHLADIMSHLDQYRINIEEIHHTNKLDAPSGTAISLAKDVISRSENKESWVNRLTTDANEIPIISKRERDVIGTHTVLYDSDIDQIQIKHHAHSRSGFAKGALLAASWIIGKNGVFTMKDVLSL